MKSRVAVLLRYLKDKDWIGFGASVFLLFCFVFLAYLPAINWVLTEDEGAMPQGKEQLTYKSASGGQLFSIAAGACCSIPHLEQDQLVKKNMPSVVA